ncbi:hypothetical protein LCGC14_0970230 [marine sediment metagenome]|uniref:Uncharacterized protein n=1 Tax=marine sediment metagenome TaxID=412755 RepID=A0A0F9NBZ0_9ZZZZ
MKCVECKKRKAIIEFSKGYLDWSHGFIKKICRECYIEMIEKELKRIKDNLKKEKSILKTERKVGAKGK